MKLNEDQIKAIDLIIEGSKAILSNAPDTTATHYVVDTDTYFSVDFGTYFSHDLNDWTDSDYQTERDLLESYEIVLNLSKLKEQLADVQLIYSDTSAIPS